MRNLLRTVSFGVIGFCLVWLLNAAIFSYAIQWASASAFTENARRFVQAEALDPSLIENCMEKGTALYCDLGEQADLRGMWITEGCHLSFPMKDGSFFTPEESQGTTPLAVVGDLVTTEGDGVSIDKTEYRITGCIGIPDVFTPVDSLILIPLQLGTRLFSETGRPLEYTLDGPMTAIETTAKNFEASGISITLLEPQTFCLQSARVGNLTAVSAYIIFLVVTGCMLALFTWFEILKRARDILAYESAGATKLQTLRMLIGRYLRWPLTALVAGAIFAWLLWPIIQKQRLDWQSLGGACLVAFVCVMAAAILARRQLQRAATESNASSPWARRVISAMLTITTAFLLLFLNVLGQAGVMQADIHEQLERTEEYEFCQVIADQTPEEHDRFLLEPTAIARLKGMHEELKNQKQYTYLSHIRQPIEIESNLPADFLYSPDTKNSISSLQVSESYFPLMGLEVTEGRNFEAEDFLDDGRATIPVILGSAYASYYDVGDVIREVEYLFRDCSLEVVGILPHGSFENLFGYPESLDHTVILPAAEYVNEPPYGSDEWTHQRCAYSQKLDGGGFLLAKDAGDRAGMTLMLAELSSRYGTSPFFLGGSQSNPSKMFTAMSGVFAENTRVAVALASLLTLLLCVQTAQYRFETQRSRFEAYRLGGATFGQLLWQTTKQVLPDLLWANFAAWILTSIFLGLSYAWWIFAGSLAVALVCIAASMWKTVRKEFIG